MRVLLVFLILSANLVLHGQVPQLPTLQSCNRTRLVGQGKVFITSRRETVSGVAGTFALTTSGIECDSSMGYPRGSLSISIDLTDSVRGTVASTILEQVTSTGKHSPTAYLTGRCDVTPKAISGCKFWLMVVDNKQPKAQGVPDVIGFMVVDGSGRRVAYGAGPLREGDLQVNPTDN
jgi:hypothetical protein